MHRQQHLALLSCHHIVLDSRGQHQQMAGVKVVRLTARRHLKMTLQHLEDHHPFRPMRSQAREMAEQKQRD